MPKQMTLKMTIALERVMAILVPQCPVVGHDLVACQLGYILAGKLV